MRRSRRGRALVRGGCAASRRPQRRARGGASRGCGCRHSGAAAATPAPRHSLNHALSLFIRLPAHNRCGIVMCRVEMQSRADCGRASSDVCVWGSPGQWRSSPTVCKCRSRTETCCTSAALSRWMTGWKKRRARPGRPRPYVVFHAPSGQSDRSAAAERWPWPSSDSMNRRTVASTTICTRASSVHMLAASPLARSTCASARRCMSSGSRTRFDWCSAIASACSARVRSRSRRLESSGVVAPSSAAGARSVCSAYSSRWTAVVNVEDAAGLGAHTTW